MVKLTFSGVITVPTIGGDTVTIDGAFLNGVYYVPKVDPFTSELCNFYRQIDNYGAAVIRNEDLGETACGRILGIRVYQVTPGDITVLVTLSTQNGSAASISDTIFLGTTSTGGTVLIGNADFGNHFNSGTVTVECAALVDDGGFAGGTASDECVDDSSGSGGSSMSGSGSSDSDSSGGSGSDSSMNSDSASSNGSGSGGASGSTGMSGSNGSGAGSSSGASDSSGSGTPYDCVACGGCCLSTTAQLQVNLTPVSGQWFPDAFGFADAFISTVSGTYSPVFDEMGDFLYWEGETSGSISNGDDTFRYVARLSSCSPYVQENDLLAVLQKFVDGVWVDWEFLVVVDGSLPNSTPSGLDGGYTEGPDCQGMAGKFAVPEFGYVTAAFNIINNNCCNQPGTGCVKIPTSSPDGFCE